jgi:maleate isomerase
MHRVVAEELERMNRDMGRCALELADGRVDVMSTACLVATMCMGNGYHRQVIEELGAAIGDAPYRPQIMTSAGALVEELKDFGARRISLMAPYSDALTKTVVEYIEHEGIEVKDVINFSILDNLEVGAGPAATARRREAVGHQGVDTVVLSACVQMPSLAALEPAQQRLAFR